MPEYAIEPEVAGGLGADTEADARQHPPIVNRLHYEFAGWLGDDIVESFPVFIVTDPLARAIKESELSGAEFDEVKVTRNPQFDEFFPDLARSFPEWRWLRPVGKPHESDFWQQPDGILVVSERALNVLRRFKIDNSEIVEI
jgi:hypothetical protein